MARSTSSAAGRPRRRPRPRRPWRPRRPRLPRRLRRPRRPPRDRSERSLPDTPIDRTGTAGRSPARDYAKDVPMTDQLLWFATRGAGIVSLLLASAVVVLGLLTTTRWQRPG